MNDFNPWDRADHRQQQQDEEQHLATLLDILDRLRARNYTDEDIDYLERELTPYSTQPRK